VRQNKLDSVRNPEIESCKLIYRLRMRSVEASEAYPRLVVRYPGDGAKDTVGKYFTAARGDTNWTVYEVSLDVLPGERPTVIELSLFMESNAWPSTGKKPKNQVWIKDIELLKAPLPVPDK
jgi:hypothetical protein